MHAGDRVYWLPPLLTFGPEELAARVRAHKRRSGLAGFHGKPAETRVPDAPAGALGLPTEGEDEVKAALADAKTVEADFAEAREAVEKKARENQVLAATAAGRARGVAAHRFANARARAAASRIHGRRRLPGPGLVQRPTPTLDYNTLHDMT